MVLFLLFYNVSWVSLIMLVCFFLDQNSHYLEIKGNFFSLILASALNALFEGVCLLWDSV